MFNDPTERAPLSGAAPLRAPCATTALALECLAEGVVVVKQAGDCCYFNRLAKEMLGAEALREPWESWPALWGLRLSDGASLCPVESFPLAQALRGREMPPQDFVLQSGAAADSRVVCVQATPLRAADGTHQGAALTLRDVTEERRREQELRESHERLRNYATQLEQANAALSQANAALSRANSRLEEVRRVDPLTGLLNRGAFDEALDIQFRHWSRRKEAFCLVLADVDYFKQVNDRFGHPAGDEVLRSLGQLLVNSMRKTDVAARYGGEEFAAILPFTKLADSRRPVCRLRSAVEREVFEFDGNEIRVTLSMGVAEIHGDDSPLSLLRRADSALYAAKNAGRNQSFFHDNSALSSG